MVEGSARIKRCDNFELAPLVVVLPSCECCRSNGTEGRAVGLVAGHVEVA